MIKTKTAVRVHIESSASYRAGIARREENLAQTSDEIHSGHELARCGTTRGKMGQVDILRLAPHGPDTFVGESPAYSWGRIYGGLVVAQALRAAMHTVEAEHSVHSLHAYFILGGDPGEPVRYEVDRLRNGRSFTTRQVVARQSSGAILTLSASFQRHEEGPDVSSVQFPSDVRAPEEIEARESVPGIDTRIEGISTNPPLHRVWARYADPIGSDPCDQAAALAYLSDTNAVDAIHTAHPARPDPDSGEDVFMSASLDHAMWFHRAVRASDWHLFDMKPEQIIGTRGLATGTVFTGDGELVATIAQQGLVRVKK